MIDFERTDSTLEYLKSKNTEALEISDILNLFLDVEDDLKANGCSAASLPCRDKAAFARSSSEFLQLTEDIVAANEGNGSARYAKQVQNVSTGNERVNGPDKKVVGIKTMIIAIVVTALLASALTIGAILFAGRDKNKGKEEPTTEFTTAAEETSSVTETEAETEVATKPEEKIGDEDAAEAATEETAYEYTPYSTAPSVSLNVPTITTAPTTTAPAEPTTDPNGGGSGESGAEGNQTEETSDKNSSDKWFR